ncbi:hypothetical protein FOTG_18458 [Fusarium oxysporum f. sp. vasinfectum 25433]|uniref:Uncharacterized protein n=1 Tax=Fusarium oxysporum f. sp. vasinfectum 25433 TaxID=1089449 RepID=X0KWL2_FUSOX|nr:hypothetical protein FOTG_18458 [Fusarium oxysporum f. sp. vasinfectum 25433]
MFFIEQDSRLCIKVQWDPPKYGLPTNFLMDYANKLSELVAVPLYWLEKSNDLIYNVRGPYYLILTMAETNSSASGDIPRFRRVGAGSPEITGGSDVQLSLNDFPIEEIDEDSWMIGQVVISRYASKPDGPCWDDGKGAFFTISEAPNPKPSTRPPSDSCPIIELSCGPVTASMGMFEVGHAYGRNVLRDADSGRSGLLHDVSP